ncbi:MAG: hypothetical protein JW740_02265 [Candidatus Zambryskibacteria bacterium]|nr:hypothetical protein [Candidatus Zambryskibacteria bacterium]
MEQLVKADIFFFISSIATVIISILVIILLIYLISAAKNLYKISKIIKNTVKIGSAEFVTDIKEYLENNIIFRLFFPPARKKNRVMNDINREN